MTVRGKTRQMAFMGLLFSLAMALSFLEGLLPAVPGLPPGVKPGLANIMVLYALVFLGPVPGLVMILLKSGMAFFTRGGVACLLSFSGSFLSFLVTLGLLYGLRNRISYLTLSVGGAVAHNLGQLITAALLLQSGLAFAYLPVLLISGAVMGSVTGLSFRALIPAFSRIHQAFGHKTTKKRGDHLASR